MQPFEIGNKPETINQRVARYRKAVGYTQNAMAAFLDKKPSTYSQEERCGEISCKDIIKIAQILGIDVRVLLYGEKYGEEIEIKPPFVMSNDEKRLIELVRFMKPRYRDLFFQNAVVFSKMR